MRSKSRSSAILLIVVILGILAAAFPVVKLILKQAGADQRKELLQQAKIISNAVNPGYVLSLSGSSADLKSPEYQRLKEQFIHIRSVVPKCRFIYLLGRKLSGEVFFYVDSEPAGSEAESPPGQVYTEVPELAREVFDSRKGSSGVPYQDRWGSWVSSFVPLIDRNTDRLVAVLGMDIDAKNWQKDILLRRQLSLNLMFILAFLVIFIVLLSTSRRAAIINQAYFRGLFEHAISAIVIHQIIFDEYGKAVDYIYLDANPEYSKQTGLKPEAIKGKKVTEVFPGIVQSKFIEIYGKVALTGEPVVFEEFFQPSGRYYNVSAYKIGKERVVTVVQDITARKRAEEKLRILYEQLKDTQAKLVQSAKMASLGILAGGVAHEINNPLTGVLNNAQLIRMMSEQKALDSQQLKEILTQIEESALRCKNITHSLLEFSRAPSESFKHVSLNEVIEKVVVLIGKELQLKNITIEKNLLEKLPDVLGDPQLLQQVILDIIENGSWAIAKKGSPGKITIKTSFDYHSWQATLSISDDGVGIPQENLEKIFEPFFTTKNTGEGTGLGLSIVYNIIKSHKGSIDAASSPGAGTTFSIRIPAVTE